MHSFHIRQYTHISVHTRVKTHTCRNAHVSKHTHLEVVCTGPLWGGPSAPLGVGCVPSLCQAARRVCHGVVVAVVHWWHPGKRCGLDNGACTEPRCVCLCAYAHVLFVCGFAYAYVFDGVHAARPSPWCKEPRVPVQGLDGCIVLEVLGHKGAKLRTGHRGKPKALHIRTHKRCECLLPTSQLLHHVGKL